MNISKDFKFGDVVCAARKQVGLTQYDLCKRMGISQSNLSKIEANTLKPTADVWIEFCESFSLPVDSFKSGYIDSINKNKIKDFSNKKIIEEKLVYQDNAFLRVRFLIPILENIKLLFGENEYYRVIKKLGLELHQIHNRDTLLNFSFVKDLLEEFELSANTFDFEKVAELARHDFVHGNLWNRINGSDTNKSVSILIKKIESYLTGYFIKHEVYSNSQVKLVIPSFPTRPSFMRDINLIEKINFEYLPSFIKAIINNKAQVQFIDEGPSFQIFIKGLT